MYLRCSQHAAWQARCVKVLQLLFCNISGAWWQRGSVAHAFRLLKGAHPCPSPPQESDTLNTEAGDVSIACNLVFAQQAVVLIYVEVDLERERCNPCIDRRQ